MKKNKRKTVIIILVVLAIFAAMFLFLRLSGTAFTVRGVSKYEKYFGENGEHRKNGLTESAIFPKSLPPSAKVEKFVYRHEDLMDPSDAAVLVYTCSKEDYEKELARLTALGTEPEDIYGVYGITLVYTCSKEDYEKELARLTALGTEPEDIYGVYGISGFPYEAVAAEADETTGVIYAMTEPEVCRFIYVENTHCNYFSDIRYPWYIGKKYLPSGYDAMPGNLVREAFETNTN